MPDPAPSPAPRTPVPAKGSETGPMEGVTVSLGKGKNVVLGGGAATGIGGLAWVIMQLFNMHGEAMGKIAAIDAKVTALQHSFVEETEFGKEQRQEMRADIRELNGSLNAITRGLRVSGVPSSGGTGTGIPLLYGEIDFDGDMTRDARDARNAAAGAKRGTGGQAVPR